MDHIHYDLDEIEKNLRGLCDDGYTNRINSTENIGEKIAYQAQKRFNEAQVLSQIEMFRLLNEGRDPAFVGSTVGAFIGNVMLNTIAASPNPALCLESIDKIVKNSLEVLVGPKADSVDVFFKDIVGTRGGRA